MEAGGHGAWLEAGGCGTWLEAGGAWMGSPFASINSNRSSGIAPRKQMRTSLSPMDLRVCSMSGLMRSSILNAGVRKRSRPADYDYDTAWGASVMQV